MSLPPTDQRIFCKGATVAMGAAMLAPTMGRAVLAADAPVAETTSGKDSGVSTDGVHAFKGVPYGASTGGRNRFMAPQKPQPWAGIRSTVDWVGRAPQSPPDRSQRPELGALSGGPDRSPETEECLIVNVWTRGLNDGGRRPIMVWFHGGGFGYGSSNTPRLDGTYLAKTHDVVVVTVNQRLNILGHMYLGDLGGEDFSSSGNAGTLEMVAALQWVRDNAGRFGGDPGNVTIFGQSGGGGKVSTLLATPAARGFFHRAIVRVALQWLNTRDRAGSREAVRKAWPDRAQSDLKRAVQAADCGDPSRAQGRGPARHALLTVMISARSSTAWCCQATHSIQSRPRFPPTSRCWLATSRMKWRSIWHPRTRSGTACSPRTRCARRSHRLPARKRTASSRPTVGFIRTPAPPID